MGLKLSMIFYVTLISLKIKILFKDKLSVPKLLLHYLILLLCVEHIFNPSCSLD